MISFSFFAIYLKSWSIDISNIFNKPLYEKFTNEEIEKKEVLETNLYETNKNKE
jgi:hypothetical protein